MNVVPVGACTDRPGRTCAARDSAACGAVFLNICLEYRDDAPFRGTHTAGSGSRVTQSGQRPNSQPLPDSARDETSLERLDRNLEEMTGELRVVVTGVQVLFAFLLIVPFNTGFAHVGPFERTVYFIALIFAALAAVCTLAPSAQHRFLFRHDDKDHIVRVSNRIVIAGLGFLAVAMCGCLLLVATYLFGAVAGAVTLAASALPFTVLWFAMPLRRRAQLERTDRSST
jgi:uncharacterized protein DUF6328